MIRADLSPIESADPRQTSRFLGEMVREGKALVATCGVPVSKLSAAIEVNVRFAGQSFELAVPASLPITSSELGKIKQSFFERYRARYHRLNRDVPLEIVSWRVTIKAPAPQVKIARMRNEAGRGKALKGHRKVFMPETGSFVSCPIYDRYALRTGARMRGPAVIEEHESTVVVGRDATIEVDPSCNLWVTVRR